MASNSKTSEKILIELEAKTAIFEKRMAESAKLLQKIERNSKSTSTALGKMGKSASLAMRSFAALAAVELGRRLVVDAVQTADAIDKMSAAAGLATEEYQRFAYAAELGGVATGKFDSAMQTFVKRVGEAQLGMGPLVSFLDKYDKGLLASIKSAKSQAEAVGLISNAMAKAKTQTEKIAIANAAFNKSNIAMVNVLDDGYAAFERTGNEATIMSNKTIESAVKMNDAWTAMQNAFQKTIYPPLIEGLTVIMATAEKVVISFQRLGQMNDILVLAGKVRVLNDRIDQTKKALNESELSLKVYRQLEKHMNTMIQQRKDYNDEIWRLKSIQDSFGDIEPPKLPPPDTTEWEAGLQRISAGAQKVERDLSMMGQALTMAIREEEALTTAAAKAFIGRGPLIDDDDLKKMDDAGEKILSTWEKVGKEVQNSSGMMADSFIDFALTGEQAFADMAKSILANLAKMILQAQIFKALSGLPGAVGSVAGAASLSPAAAMAGPAIGTFGSTPTSGITLGAAKSAGVTGGATFHMDVHNNAPVQVQTESKQNSSGGVDIALYIEKTVGEYFDSGGGDAMMARTYGGRRMPR